MKKFIALLMFLGGYHTLQAGSNEGLFNWKLDNAVGSIYYKLNTVGAQSTVASYGRIGFILDEAQLLYIGKGGSFMTADLVNPAPSPYLMGSEFIGYEYLIDLGFFLDIGISLEVGDLVLGNGTTSTFGASAEGSILAIVNLSQNIKLQFGYGQRYTLLNDADLAAMTLQKSDVDKSFYSLSLEIGAF